MINAYYNGKFADKEDIRIPLTDRSIFFGDAIYEAAIGRNGKIFMLDRHIERLFDNARALDVSIDTSRKEMKNLLLKVIAASGINADYFVYIQISRQASIRAHAYPSGSGSNLLITVTPIEIPQADKKLKLVSYPDIRYMLCNVKTVNLLPAVLASKYAENRGADEAVFVRDGIVTECSKSNVHIIKNGILYTHPKSNFILPGISREHLISVCHTEGIECREIAFTKEEMLTADQVLVTSSSKICLRAECFDGAYYGENCQDAASAIIGHMRKDYYESML